MLKAKYFFIVLISSFLIYPFISNAIFVGETKSFYVDKDFDDFEREKVDFILKRVGTKAYYFVDKSWYDNLPFSEKVKVDSNLAQIANEFDLKIYPQTTQTFGSEWTPGIDNDQRIFIVFHKLKDNSGGYFLNINEYPVHQFPGSNEKEMIYLSSDILLNDNLRFIYSLISHEFLHLITFNQKERLQNKTEEVWLQEAISETAPTILGYNNPYKGSLLESRVNQFLSYPFDSIVEWQNSIIDYSSVSVFVNYILDNYSANVFVDTLKSDSIGAVALHRSLLKNGGDNFFDVFMNWITASVLQDCNLNSKFCYKSDGLKEIKIIPKFIFLPSTTDTNLSLQYSIKPFSFSAYKIVAGEGKLSIEFVPKENDIFRVRFLSCVLNKCNSFKDFEVRNGESITFSVDDFSKDSYIIMIPVLETKIVGFSNFEPAKEFTLNISIENKSSENNNKEEQKKILLSKITELKAKLKELEAQLKELLKNDLTCTSIDIDLFYGMQNDYVKCLQEFLSLQEDDIYPEKLVTGYFGPLTLKAVKKFQEKYKDEILTPINLSYPTGYVGPMTRKKINELILGI